MVVKARGYVDFIFCDKPFTTKSELWSYRAKNTNTSIKYVTYWCQQNIDHFQDIARLNSVKLPQLKVSDTDDYYLPLPPREVQDKIVEILDTLAALCENLDTEIAQREQQFTVYREKLLSVDYMTTQSGTEGVKYARLGDVAVRQRGTAITATKMKELDTPSGEVRVFAAGSTEAKIEKDKLPQTSIHTEPSMVVKARGYIDFIYYDAPFTTKSELWSYRAGDGNTSIKYVTCWAQQNVDHFQNTARLNGVKLPQLKVSDTDDYRLPLPSRKVQDEVVAKLDAMQELIDNLRLERKQRQQQFNYYREILLSFPKKNTAEV